MSVFVIFSISFVPLDVRVFSNACAAVETQGEKVL